MNGMLASGDNVSAETREGQLCFCVSKSFFFTKCFFSLFFRESGVGGGGGTNLARREGRLDSLQLEDVAAVVGIRRAATGRRRPGREGLLAQRQVAAEA
jgi:hypothetical protein